MQLQSKMQETFSSNTASKIEFLKSKDGNDTCRLGTIHLHSAYSPLQEAKRFSDSQNCDFIPNLLILIEPALGYCIPHLKEKYNCPLCIIRLTHDFDSFNEKCSLDFSQDKILYIEDIEKNPDLLLQTFGESSICAAFTTVWPASQKAFPLEVSKAAEILKNQIQKSRDILGTRSYFGKRWFLNALKFCKNVKNLKNTDKILSFKTDKNTNQSIIICASGPSLKNMIPYLKKVENDAFIICVSSAYSTLKKNDIKIDLCISTDGGYYAKKHMAPAGLSELKSKNVWAVTSESAFVQKIYDSNYIIPLIYNDSPEKDLTSLFEIQDICTKAERNGTVTGTAFSLAKTLTTGNIFLLGTDLAPCPEFQHTQPNALEIENSIKDFKLKNKETRLVRSRFSGEGSLSIYRQWFSNLGKEEIKNTFRISSNYEFSFKLGNIPDKNADFMIDEIENQKNNSKIHCIKFYNHAKNEIFTSKDVLNFIQISSNQPHLSKNVSNNIQKTNKLKSLSDNVINLIQFKISDIFPLESLLYLREKDPERKQKFEKSLKEKEASLVRKARII